MGLSGGYGIANRGGKSRDSEHELIHKDLNYDQGTGISQTPGSIAWCENYAVAKALAAAWSAIRLFKNQFSPSTMGISLSQWEQQLNITPPVGSTESQRQIVISAKFRQVTQPPTAQQVTDLLKQLLGSIFVDLEYRSTTQNLGSLPGGVTIPGGVTLPNGAWVAPLYIFFIRIWQPRDKSNNLLMSNAQFLSTFRSYQKFLSGYMPSYVMFQPLQYIRQINGTISASSGSPSIVGFGTNFTTQLSVGKPIEVVDDNNILNTFTIASITDDTHLIITTNTQHSLTGCFARKLGFFLDFPNNLDNYPLE